MPSGRLIACPNKTVHKLTHLDVAVLFDPLMAAGGMGGEILAVVVRMDWRGCWWNTGDCRNCLNCFVIMNVFSVGNRWWSSFDNCYVDFSGCDDVEWLVLIVVVLGLCFCFW